MTDAFEIEGEARASRWLITCDHASNRVPDWIGGGDLGLPTADMERHIAYDVGALGMSRVLAEALDAPMIASTFSRLVIDPNRGEHDPTVLMRLYDGSVIPANRDAGAEEQERRLEALHRPYHRALGALADRRDDTLVVAIHSFTKQFKGREERPWHVAVLYDGDTSLAAPLLKHLKADRSLCVGDNEPYAGGLPGDSMDRHGTVPGRPHVLIEVRNDLIETAEAQAEWGLRLAEFLRLTLQDAAV